MGVLTGISAILFFWTLCGGTEVWGLISDEYFQATIVFALLGFGMMSGMCSCCRGGWKMSCACNCGDCSGGKCDNMHGADHQAM